MERKIITPRTNWQRIVETQGLEFHTPVGDSGKPETYWNEAAYYKFTMKEVDAIERAANDLFEKCLEACQHIIDEKRFAELAIPDEAIPLIVNSWNAEPPALYGRFDFSLVDGIPKMLELNGDTPTSLLEAAVVQWNWKEDVFPKLDQFNSIHEHLVAKWKDVAPYLPGDMVGKYRGAAGKLVHFAAMDSIEDLWTIAYLARTAKLAGLATEQLQMKEIGWNEDAGEFRDLQDRPIRSIFKLYPWEFLLVDAFGDRIGVAETMWIEPAWKMLLSNKGLLPILWELNPGHPNLLKATFDAPSEEMWGWAKKPLLSREGANVVLKDTKAFVHAGGDQGYGEEGVIFQDLAPLPQFPEGETTHHAVIGAWVVDGVSCGMGIRESNGPITGNASRFVPHVIDG